MNDRKFCFISCVTDNVLFEKCKSLIYSLHIPEGYEIDVLSVEEVGSIAEDTTKELRQAMLYIRYTCFRIPISLINISSTNCCPSLDLTLRSV